MVLIIVVGANGFEVTILWPYLWHSRIRNGAGHLFWCFNWLMLLYGCSCVYICLARPDAVLCLFFFFFFFPKLCQNYSINRSRIITHCYWCLFFKWSLKYVAESLKLISKGVSRVNTTGELALIWIPVMGFAVQGELGIHVLLSGEF